MLNTPNAATIAGLFPDAAEAMRTSLLHAIRGGLEGLERNLARGDVTAMATQLIATLPLCCIFNLIDAPPVLMSPPTIAHDRPSHSPDFASVRWNGTLYTLSPMQRRIVQQLWKAWENGTPFLSGNLLLEGANSAGHRVSELFRRSPAWENLITRGSSIGGPPGTYCLTPLAQPGEKAAP